jgi:hypothetical protein
VEFERFGPEMGLERVLGIRQWWELELHRNSSFMELHRRSESHATRTPLRGRGTLLENPSDPFPFLQGSSAPVLRRT